MEYRCCSLVYDSSGQLLRDNRVLTASLTIKCNLNRNVGNIRRRGKPVECADRQLRQNARRRTGNWRFFVEVPGTTVMRHCNHCHGQLGLIVHRKWMLRFCSKSCKKAYEHKLREESRAKLRHLAFLAPGAQTN
jgi:hypothetical protein